MVSSRRSGAVPAPAHGDRDVEVKVSVAVRNLRKTFQRTGGEEVFAVDDVSLDVRSGEMVVLLGPSGCGKTTLLRCIAGLEHPGGGEVVINGEPVAGPGMRGVPPERRNIGMMFQSYALWPHMTVRRNVAYPLEARKIPKADVEARVMDILRVVGIESLVAQHPAQLSGGQQQRVALARSLVAGPSVMLFDEPLSNVDAKVREQLRYEIVDMQRRLGFAGIYVTHDQEEAMQLANRLAVMSAGKIVQIGFPREVYNTPTTKYVAQFVGALNVWKGRQPAGVANDQQLGIEVDGLGEVRVPADKVSPAITPGDDVSLIARPEALVMSERQTTTCVNAWDATILRETFVGAHTEYLLALPGGLQARCWSSGSGQGTHHEGASVQVSIDPEHLMVLPDEQQPERATPSTLAEASQAAV